MTGIRYTKDSDDIVTLQFDLHGSVNKIDLVFIEEFGKALDQLEKEDNTIKGVIITSAKDSFIAGADLKAILSLTKKMAADFLYVISLFKSLLRRLEKLSIPVVAAINGSALGGGIEFTLACHHRIAINAPSIQLGLPEITLGLAPGGGGIVRLIHLLGAEYAIPYILSGCILSPPEALKKGLINELANDRKELMQKAKAWIQNNPHAQQPWDMPDHKIPGGDMRNPKMVQWIAATTASIVKKTCGGNLAIQEILYVASQVLSIHFDAAQRVESRSLVKLALTQEAKNKINTLFLQLNEINNGKSRPKNIPHFSFEKIGILGAGMMGRGIALVCAKKGINVILKDINHSSAHAGKESIEKYLEGDHNKAAILSRIYPTEDPHDLQDCDLIIEAVFENVDIKAKVTKETESYINKKGIFASNTSTLPISLLANAIQKPENFIGIHFFSPVDKMRLIEIIVGKKTSKETLAKAFDFARKINKTPIIINDSRGFFTSRVFGTFLDEGARLLEEGVNPVKIEHAAKLAGMPVGPLAISDEISQKLIISIAETNDQLDIVLGKATAMNGEASLRVAKILVEKYHRSGKAYDGGFYEYPEKGKKYLWPELKKLFGIPQKIMPTQDIQDRLLFRQALEAVRCYDEGVLNSVAEANIGSIFGIGFPSSTGGILQFINAYGLDAFYSRALELTNQYGDRFSPPALLKSMAAKKKLFE
ncbi:MAG: enoyl-CoA hydratase/isomerase family protein [Gammaproteobacteria bacterium]|nr:enoyl-CoA hydratase/isomerase family protein [Gammaproteobacteria bacterium]